VLTVPSSAVQRGPQGLYAWVVKPNDTAEIRLIQTGPSAGDVTIVSSGLSEGERTVTSGDYKLQPNAPVTVARSGSRSTS